MSKFITKPTKTLVLSTLVISLTGLASCVSAPTNEDTLTDTDLIRIAKQKEAAPTEGEQQWVVGYHHGTEVVKSFRCSDLCPENTLRIIYYNVPDVESCARIGGVTKQILVPIAITVAPRPFCFPQAIADNWEGYLP
jgi:hypothetical protein